MVPESSVEIWDSEKVLEPTPETRTTEKILILTLETEDALLITLASSNAEDMVDQTKETRALKLMSDALENHGLLSMSRQAKNTELPEKDGSKERARDGRWRPLTAHYFWDNNYGASIVCRDLGYRIGIRHKKRNHNNRDLFDTETGNRRCSRSNLHIL
jgi:hypothetical protein